MAPDVELAPRAEMALALTNFVPTPKFHEYKKRWSGATGSSMILTTAGDTWIANIEDSSFSREEEDPHFDIGLVNELVPREKLMGRVPV